MSEEFEVEWARDVPKDTSPSVAAKYRAMLLALSGEERLKMGDSMYATARALVVASILEAYPTATPVELRCAVFLRFYGHEFDLETRSLSATGIFSKDRGTSPSPRPSSGKAWRYESRRVQSPNTSNSCKQPLRIVARRNTPVLPVSGCRGASLGAREARRRWRRLPRRPAGAACRGPGKSCSDTARFQGEVATTMKSV